MAKKKNAYKLGEADVRTLIPRHLKDAGMSSPSSVKPGFMTFFSPRGKVFNRLDDVTDQMPVAPIEFTHINTGIVSRFKAFVTGFQDRFTGDWVEKTRVHSIGKFARQTGANRVI